MAKLVGPKPERSGLWVLDLGIGFWDLGSECRAEGAILLDGED